MKQVHILRGLPGAGKSSVARQLLEQQGIAGNDQCTHSTDRYFYNDAGEYHQDPSRFAEFHRKNKQAFITSLKKGAPIVICDNTNMCQWEYAPYIMAAKKYNYEISVQLVGSIHDPEKQKLYHSRNSHDVALSVIQNMAKRYEPHNEKDYSFSPMP